MAIQSARVLDDGFTLEVDGAWDASTYDDFQLFDTAGNSAAGVRQWDEATARVVLTVQSPGYNRVGNEAVAGTVTRTVVCHDVRGDFTIWPDNPTKAGPVNPALPQTYGTWPSIRALNRDIREVDLGGGNRRIRLRLHKPIQPGDTFTVQFRAGWRAGLGAEAVSGAACVNNSALPIVTPAVRWVQGSYEGTRGSALAPVTTKRFSVLAAHPLPSGKLGVAGVRFVATDGVNKKIGWASLDWDTQYGDNLRCWTANVDLTGLNAGPCVCHWSVFTHTGQVRHSSGALDPATAAASDLLPLDADWNTVGIDTRAQNPLIFGYDPIGTYYGYTDSGSVYRAYVCIAIDPAGGVTANPTTRAQAEAMCGFGDTAEAARTAALAVAQSGRAFNNIVAMTALRLLGRNLPSAQVNGRGRAARTNAGDGFEMFLVDGVHSSPGGASVGGTTSVGDIWVTMRGNGDTVCTFQSAPSGSATNINYGLRMRLVNMRADIDVGGWFATATNNVHFVQCDLGRTTSSTSQNLCSNIANANRTNFSYFNCRLRPGPSWASGNNSGLVVRSCRFRSSIGGPAIVNCETYGGITESAVRLTSGLGVTGFAEQSWQDIFRWGNRLYYLDMPRTNTVLAAPEFTVGTRRKLTRFVLVNNLVEVTRMEGATSGFDQPVVQIGEGGNVPMDVTGCIVEGNTIVGQRMNMFYNELTGTNTFTQTQDVTHGVFYNQNRIAGNIFDQWATKGATIAIASVDSARAAALPAEPSTNRAYLTQADYTHQPNHGVMVEENVVNFFTGSTAVQTFRPENRGLKCIVPDVPDSNLNADFVRYQNPLDYKHGATGGGDYRARADALWRSWVRASQVDCGADGVERTGTAWPAGALAEAHSSGLADSFPDASRHQVGSTPGLLSFFPPVAAVNVETSWIPVGNLEPQLSVTTGEVPSGPWRRIRVGPESRFRIPERN